MLRVRGERRAHERSEERKVLLLLPTLLRSAQGTFEWRALRCTRPPRADLTRTRKSSRSLTSDQVFHLRRQLCSLDGLGGLGGAYASVLNAYIEADPGNYSGLKKQRRVLMDSGEGLSQAVEPLWGVVGAFDSNMAQSVNLVVTLQTGLSSQAESLKQMEEELVKKAGVDRLEGVEGEAAKLRAASMAMEGEVKSFGGRVNELNENTSDLNNKVIDIYDKMENIVDEEKLKESVKKLLEL